MKRLFLKLYLWFSYSSSHHITLFLLILYYCPSPFSSAFFSSSSSSSSSWEVWMKNRCKNNSLISRSHARTQACTHARMHACNLSIASLIFLLFMKVFSFIDIKIGFSTLKEGWEDGRSGNGGKKEVLRILDVGNPPLNFQLLITY